MELFIMFIVLLHLAIGFGWLLYKLEFEKKDKKEDSK